MVICVPEIEKSRYYSIQLTSMYTFNFGYIGSRATGNGAGCYMVTGPSWRGEKPDGNTAKVFNSETDFNVAIFRTQLFGPSDMDNVKKIQAGYKAQMLSQFQQAGAARAAPAALAQVHRQCIAAAYLNVMMTYTPTVPEEVALRARFAEIGIGAGKPYNYEKLSLENRLAEELGIKRGFERIEQERDTFGTCNGWRVTYSASATVPIITVTGWKDAPPRHWRASSATTRQKPFTPLPRPTAAAASSTAASTITSSRSRRTAIPPSTHSGQ